MRRNRVRLAGVLVIASSTLTVTPSAGTVRAASILVTAAFDVTANDGLCTLREAITAANTDTASGAAPGECAAGSGADTITLAADTTYDVVPSPNLPGISTDVTLAGNGSTIQSRAVLRVMQVDAGATAVIRDLTLTHRFATTGITGRGFINRGTTTLRNVTVTDNSEVGHGGGIFNGDDVDDGTAELTIVDSTIDENANVPASDTRDGGGVHNHEFARLTIIGSTISANTADRDGGGVSHIGEFLRIEGSTIEGNSGRVGGGLSSRPPSTAETVEIVDSEFTSNDGRDGGGISVTAGMATLTGLTVTDNDGSQSGGGIWTNTAVVTITDSAITGNTAQLLGGGIAGMRGEMRIEDGLIADNESGRLGGGLFRFSGLTNIVSTTVRDNLVLDDFGAGQALGGGIYASSDETTITGSSISGNVARLTSMSPTSGGEVYGGGIHAEDADLTIDRTTITGNTAELNNLGIVSGGGLYRQSGRTTVTDSTIDGNTAASLSMLGLVKQVDGGGVYTDGSIADFTNTTISGNRTDRSGGGIYQTPGSPVTLTASTVTANTAGNSGGVWASEMTMTASVVAGNAGDEDVTGGTITSGGFNVMGVLDVGGDPFIAPGDVSEVADPELGPLANNGGPTRTHRPRTGSPVLDRVTGAYSGSPSTDQRGVARPQGRFADSGAVEREVVFSSQVPQRFADSRDEDTFDGRFRDTGPRGAGTVWEIDVAGRGDVPADASAAIVNVTVLNGTGPGHATVYPCTDDVPNASSINYAPGSVEPNELIAKLSTDGTVCIITFTDADVIVDVVGAVSANSPYTAVTPSRYADSRDQPTFDGRHRDTGIRRAGTTWEIPIAGRGGVPAGATTAAINLTVTQGDGDGFATVHPCGSLPLASSLNYGPGVTRPNELLTKLSASGTICVYTFADVHAIVDVVGYVETTQSWTATVPARFADSRDQPTFDGQERATGLRAGGTTWEIPIAGRGDVPASATTAAVNLTVTGGVGPGFATVHPCGALPLASSINYDVGVTRPNELVAKLSPDGTICVYTFAGVHVIVDVVGHDG